MLDFARAPEVQRGVSKNRDRVNWDALELVADRSEGGTAGKAHFKRKFLKAVRENGIEALTPQFRYSYCCARLALGDFSSYFGWEFRDEWSARLYWEETWMPKWGGGNVDRLLIVGEQGVGDAIFYASIVPEAMARAKEVIFECDDRLHSLFTRSLPGLIVKSERAFEDRREDYGEIDAFIPAADLMRMFRRQKSDFPGKPYLKADPKRVMEHWNEGRHKIGVAWRGRQGILDPVKLGISNAISVQYKDFHRDIPQARIDLWSDIEGLAALCQSLEKVVTVPQTVHHIAGAIGKKVEIITPELPGEATNQIKWDCSPLLGKLPWYADCSVYRSLAEWKRCSARGREQ